MALKLGSPAPDASSHGAGVSLSDDLAVYIASTGMGHGNADEVKVLWKFMTPQAHERYVDEFKASKTCPYCHNNRPCDAHPDEIVSKCPHELVEGDTWCEICQPRMTLSPSVCHNDFCPDAKWQPSDPDVRFVTLAKDGDTDLEYCNLQHSHFGDEEGKGTFHVTKVVKLNNNGTVRIRFWADNLQEWLECDVPWHYRMTTAPEYVSLAARPPVFSAEDRARRASHLLQYKRERKELPVEPSQPDRCIVGQVGADKVLVDAGNGTVLARYSPTGFVPQLEAQKLGRKLVGQAAATKYAITILRRAWADAKAGAK